MPQFLDYDKYAAPDYFMPANMMDGIMSAEEWRKNGVPVKVLNDLLIYPSWGVFSPTQQDHLTVIDLMLKELKDPE